VWYFFAQSVCLLCLLAQAVFAEAPVASESEQQALIAQGEIKSVTCVACHQADGNSIVPAWPKLAGQHEAYLLKQLKAFHAGETGPRNEPSMYAMVAALTDEDFKALAAYYAAQSMSEAKTPEQFVSLGERLYRGGDLKRGIPACMGCHGPAGMGLKAANIPRLSSQHAESTLAQLQHYRNDNRKTDPQGMMREIAKRLTEKEMTAVSHYVAGLYDAS